MFPACVPPDTAEGAPGLPREHARHHGPGCLPVHGGARNGGASEGVETPV